MTSKDCETCANRCMDMDMDPYCAAVNKPYGYTGIPQECGEDRKLWQIDKRGWSVAKHIAEKQKEYASRESILSAAVDYFQLKTPANPQEILDQLQKRIERRDFLWREAKEFVEAYKRG